ncbi:thiol-disulfide oxidoreductase DCC family protein [Conchiformibius kuhniae]|uniref:Thiol-disulfide oxidoreductase DCC family protein n=1 Tax=Conchiformibius kuhniae TaxID=211502 RepID=A0A8T9MSD8_9NEIS|nr:DUF393 domain-containing protein [Conchiformibius kuhniae]
MNDKHQIFYDADCPVCAREIALLLARPKAAHIAAVPIQGNEMLLAQYGINRADAMRELHLRTPAGETVRGMAALRLMHRLTDGFWLLRLTGLPVLRPLCDWLYPHFARHRNRFPAWLLPRPRCENGACQMSKHSNK